MRRIVFALLFVFTQALALPAKDPKWFEVSSDHFQLFTDTNEMKGRRLVADFETRIATLAQVLGKIPPRQFPIEVFLFSDEKDFMETLPRIQGTDAEADELREKQMAKNAYLLHGPDRLFVVAKDKSPDAIANDVGHAIGHAIFERYVIWRPFWFTEGAAEYVRKIGRSPDTKPIPEEEGFSTADMFTIVPSGTFDDNAPATAFRTEAYRLFRFLSEQKPEDLRQYLKVLRSNADKLPKSPIDAESIDSDFKKYTETPLKALPVTPAVKVVEADMSQLAVHRGDLLLATERQSEASRWYNADAKEARAARAIVSRFTRPPAEAVRILERASRELPDMGLVQYNFGAMEIQDQKDVQSQVAALERATQLLPLMGRAFAELARVYALSGPSQAERGLAAISKALDLEPEYADRIYEIRADVDLALGRSADALHDINMAADLPHPDRSAIPRYNLKIAGIRKRIETARREVDARDLDAIRREVDEKRQTLEPPPKPAPPAPPVPSGIISYEIETRAAIEVVDAVYPEYTEALRRQGAAGTITTQVDIGPDGKVKTATIANSQIPDLNKSTLDAIKKWSFKPGNRSVRVVLKFALQ
jgi:TonB family protein